MAIHHLVARGVDMASQVNAPTDRDQLRDILQDPKNRFGLGLLLVTFLMYMGLHTAISYTYGLLVPTLVTTEAPATTTVIKTTEYRDEESESPDAPLLTKEEKESMTSRDEEVLVITHKPITSKFCSIVRHLRQKTGSRLSRFRGAGGYIAYNLIAAVAANVTRIVFGRSMGVIFHIPVTAALCLFSTAWVQQTVAMPGKSYFQRVSQLRKAGVFKQLFLSVFFVEAVELAVLSLPGNVMILINPGQMQEPSEALKTASVVISSLLTVFTVVFAIVVIIPLNIGLVRFQASLLPEEEETVIPIDRTLVNDEKSVRSGWKSFSREGLVRLIKTLVKVFFMQTALSVLFLCAAVLEVKMFMGSTFDQAVDQYREYREEMRH